MRNYLVILLMAISAPDAVNPRHCAHLQARLDLAGVSKGKE